MSRRYLSIEEAVIGEVLPVRRRRRKGQGGRGAPTPLKRLTRSTGAAARTVRFQRALRANVRGVPQAVIKRVVNGGVHDRVGLKNLLTYVTRDEAATSVWHEQGAGLREFGETAAGRLATDWQAGWRGAPKRGHVDHIVMSFPKGTDAGVAAAIARDWGEAMLGSGDYGDRWRYVAALHTNTDQVHAHFAVEKHGLDEGRFLSISKHSAISYDVMKAVEVEIAARHGLELTATSRLSRGIVEYPPRPTEVKALTAHRHATGEIIEPTVPPMSAEERARRLEAMAAIGTAYDEAAALLSLSPDAGPPETFVTRLSSALKSAAQSLSKGVPIVSDLDFTDTLSLDDDIAQLREKYQTIVSQLETYPASPERVEVSTMLARAAQQYGATLFPNEPAMQAFVPAVDDPYRIDRLTALAEAAESGTLVPEARMAAQTALDATRDDLVALFDGRAEELARFRTTAEELAERFLAPVRGGAAIRLWDAQTDVAETVLWAELRQEMAEEAATAAAVHELPMPTLELIARDALLAAEASLPLSDVAALSQLAEWVEERLDPAELKAVVAGDEEPLRASIADPILRHAVVEEIRFETQHAELDVAVGAEVAAMRGQGYSRAHISERSFDIEDRVREEIAVDAEAPTVARVQAAYAAAAAEAKAKHDATNIHTI